MRSAIVAAMPLTTAFSPRTFLTIWLTPSLSVKIGWMPSKSPAIAAAALMRPDLRITLSVYAVSRISIRAYLSFRYSTTASIVSPSSSLRLASITPAPSAIE